MVQTTVALAIIATTIVVLALLTLATVRYVPATLPGGDHGHGSEAEDDHATAGHPA